MRRQSDLGAAHVASRRKFVELAKNRVVSVHVDEENNGEYQAALRDEPVQVRRAHSDGAKEYVALREELDDATAHTFSPAYTPGLHSTAERVNRTMADAARTMLIGASLPSTSWPHGVKHAVAVHNRVPRRAAQDTPSCLLNGVRLSVKYVRVLGSTAYVVLQPAGTKLQPRTKEGVLPERSDHYVTMCCWSEETALPRASSSHDTARLTRRASWAPKALMRIA
jgi:hypothetical protein